MLPFASYVALSTGPIPERDFFFSDERVGIIFRCVVSSSAASSSGDTWVTDESADVDPTVPLSVDPAFDRQRQRLRYSALKRAGTVLRSRPRSYASVVRKANRTI